MSKRVVITGAFSYTGAAIARVLSSRGWQIHTLTNRTPPTEVTLSITAAPLKFDREYLIRELRNADALVSTFWVRFPHAGQSFETALTNGRMLFEAAHTAKVKRIVHVSVSNADSHSHLGYYRGKGQLDETLKRLNVPFAIVRPTLIVGPNDILTNNIAWFLRRFPFFCMPANGAYRLQPITLDDCAEVIADAVESRDDLEWDVAGPEVFTFREFVTVLAGACGLRHRALPSTPLWLTLASLRLLGSMLRDIVLTKQELEGLMEERLISNQPPRGKQSVRDWLMANGRQIGCQYANDLHRHFGAGRYEAISDIGKPR